VIIEALGQRLDESGTLMKRQLAKIWTTDVASVLEHRTVVQSISRRVSNDGPRRGVAERDAITAA
jgi:hypothetical protein